MHGTLGHVVDRLATIEKDIRGEARPPALWRMPPAAQLPIDSDLPPDQPLEPGSGPPPLQANPAARIAASEAALGGTRPAAAPGGKSSFIAAARRAAQAAGQEPSAPPRAEPDEAHESETPSLRAKMMKRVKSLFLAASIIAIVVGLVQIAGNVLDLRIPPPRPAQAPASITETTRRRCAPPRPNRRRALPPNRSSCRMCRQWAARIAASQPFPTTPPNQPDANDAVAVRPADARIEERHHRIDFPPGRHQPSAAASAPSPLPSQQSADRLPVAIGGPKLRSAAIAGDSAAAYEVAVRFAEGRGVPVNMDEAARWYERAASKGLTPAQFRYASLLEKGIGVKKDLAQARRLYLAAANKGNSKAMHNLAVLYAEGIDGKPDYATAVQWFRKAAQRGVADSQFNLGVLCARGLGTEKSYAEAYKWFALAAVQGDEEAAKKRDEVAAGLDAAALAAAQQTVKSFVAEPQPQDASVVRAPPGGWDAATGTPPHAKPRVAGPLALGTFEAGKR